MNNDKELKIIPDQIQVWDKKHANGDHASLMDSPSPLAEFAEPFFPRNSKIIELGCGVGRDAVYFSRLGHEVEATDGSEVVINQNIDHYRNSKVIFRVVDIKSLGSIQDKYDVVFSNLALHYYTDSDTRLIFDNIAQIIKPRGIIAFASKSYDSLRTDGANKIENNVYVDKNNHAIHLFTQDYARELVSRMFDVISLDEVDEEYMGRVSGVVRCIARKKK